MPILKRKDFADINGILQDLDKLQKGIDDVTKSLQDLQKQTRQVNATSTGSEAKQRIELTQKLNKGVNELTTLQKERIKTENQLKTVLAKNLQTQEKNALTLAKGKIRLQENNKLLKQQAKEALGLVGAYDKLSKELNENRKAYKNLAAAGKANTKEAKAQLKAIQALDNRLKSIDNSVGQNQRSVGKYTNALKGLGSQLLGAAGIVGGVDLLITGFQKLAERSKEITKLTRQVTQTFRVSTSIAKQYSSQILALANNFDSDYNEIMNAANAVSKEFGITGSAALDLIEEGFKKGSNNSGQFLDILKEYPTQLKSIGLSADESFAIINQQVREGIYSDKGIDALKEAGLRLRENTKAVQSALAPLDESIKKQIEQEVAAGNTFKAIQLVSEALNDTSLTAEQTQAIIADVFGGAGEDAGIRYLQTLEDINLSLEDVGNQTSFVEEANLSLSESWNNLVGTVSDSESVFSKVWGTVVSLVSGAIAELTRFIQIVTGETPKASDRLKELAAALEAKAKAQQESTESTEENTKSQRKNNQVKKQSIDLLRDEEKLIKDITQGEIELLENGRRRAILQAEEDRKQRLKDIENAKASKATKDAAIELLERQHLQRLRDINNEFPELETASFTVGQETDPLKELQKGIDEQNKIINDGRKKDAENLAQWEQAKLDIKKEAEQAFISFASDLGTAFIDERLQKELDAAEAEKAILQDKLDKGEISEKEFNEQIAKINKRQRQAEAKAEKRKALFDIAIATAIAVAKAGFITPAAFAAAAAGAIQAGLVAARPIPQFEEGEVNIKGKRHKEGGIIAEIEGGESVINRKGTKNAPKLLESINKGLISDTDAISMALNPNRDLNGLTKNQHDGLMATLLMQGNKQNEQIIQALGNLFGSYEKDGIINIGYGNGSIKKIVK